MVVVLILPWFALGFTLYHPPLFCTQRNNPISCQDPPPLVCCVVCLTGSTGMRWKRGEKEEIRFSIHLFMRLSLPHAAHHQ